MDWTFDTTTHRYSKTIGVYEASVWQEREDGFDSRGDWAGQVTGPRSAVALYAFESVDEAQDWCDGEIQARQRQDAVG